MKRLLIFALAINLVMQLQYSFACGGGGYEDEDYEARYFFSPALLSDTSMLGYYPRWTVCDDCGELLKKAVIEEWHLKFPSCSQQDISAAVFSASLYEEAKTLKSGNNPRPKNSFYAFLIANNLTEVMDYLLFISEENKMMMGSDNSWGQRYWEAEQKNLKEANRLLEIAQGNLGVSKDAFIREKYGFQIVKLLHYAENFDKAISSFKTFYPYPSTTLTYYRTLGYYAGAKRKAGQEAEAKYLFATIFDKCPPIRYQAYNDFKFIDQDENQWRNTLAMARSESEKSILWITKNLYDDTIDIEALKGLYASDSGHNKLEMALLWQLNNFHYQFYIPALKGNITIDTNKLVTQFQISRETAIVREKKQSNWFVQLWEGIVNFFENLFGKSKTDSFHWKDQVPDIKYKPFVFQGEWTEELMELLDKILSEKKIKRTHLFSLAKGYLQICTGNFKEGEITLEAFCTDPYSEYKSQSEYMILWSQLLNTPVLTQEIENRLLTYLMIHKDQYLEKELTKRYFIERQYDKAFQSLKRHDKLIFFDNNSIKQIIIDGNKNLEPAFISAFGKIDVNKLKASFAEKLFLEGKFEEAHSFDNLKLEFYEEGGYDEDEKATEGKYIREAITYADIITLDKKATAASYLQIAEALATSSSLAYNSIPCYNDLPYSRRASEYPFNVPELAETVESRSNYYNKLFYSTDLSESYYRKAHDLLKSDEEKASALVGAQEVAMRDKYVFKDRYKSSKDINKSYYYKELREKYPNTNIVKELSKSCSFYRNEKITYY